MAEQLAVEVNVKNMTEHTAGAAAAAGQALVFDLDWTWLCLVWYRKGNPGIYPRRSKSSDIVRIQNESTLEFDYTQTELKSMQPCQTHRQMVNAT